MNMSETFSIMQKQGGFSLIRRFAKNRVLFTAVAEFLLLGKSRTALEILRLATELKTKQKLYKKYYNVLENFEKGYADTGQGQQSNRVWVCWFQGMENAPLMVQTCYKSLLGHLDDREIVLITADNMMDYVDFPEYIVEKWKKGIITHTHMTDLLRLELLIKYGGTWIDATVLCTKDREDIPDYFFDSDLFYFQTLKPGKDGESIGVSSWYLSACSNNKILCATRYLCYEYWKRNDEMVDYYLLHYFFVIALERYEEEAKKVVPFSNSTPHILLLKLFEPYDEKMYRSIVNQSPFHKLSYKFTDELINREGTYYRRIVNS